MRQSAATPVTIGEAYLGELRRRLGERHARIKHCVDQLTDAQLWWRPHPAMNSVANIILHLCGNLRQWIIAGATKTPDTRNRPQEFAERGSIAKAELLRQLDTVVQEADTVLASISDAQLLEPRRIQGFDETVLTALFDSVAHFHGHAQEIVYITRLQLGEAYRFAWAPATPEQGAPS